MTNKTLRTGAVKAFSMALVALTLIVSNPLHSLANDGSKKAALTDEQVSVQYVGTNNDYVVFRVKFENTTGQKFWLIVKNDAGETVYRKQFSDAHFAKSISLLREDAEIHPTFVISNGDSNIVRQFSVSKEVTEKTIITEL